MTVPARFPPWDTRRQSLGAVAFEFVRKAGRRGVTVAELRNRTGWHHGQASGALSRLNSQGMIARLDEHRGKSGVYVTVNNIGGRAVVHPRRNPRRKEEATMPAAEIRITGNLTKDPEVRTTPKGHIACKLSVACNESRKNEDGTWDEVNTSFYDVTVWGRQGERCADALHKGQGVHVVGKLTVTVDQGDVDAGQHRQKYVNISAYNVFAAVEGRKEAPVQQYEGEPPW